MRPINAKRRLITAANITPQDQINKKGGINGQKVIILREDDRVDPALSRAVLARMIDTEHIQAVIGSAGSLSGRWNVFTGDWNGPRY